MSTDHQFLKTAGNNERYIKKIQTFFENKGLQIIIKCNLKIADNLAIT